MSAMESRRVGAEGGLDPARPGRKAERKVVELGGPVAASGSKAPAPAAAGSGAAFQVLLERLQRQARELQESAGAVEKPDELAGAVDRARASLDDALSLSDRLLEAWRAERMTPKSPESTDR